MVHLSADNLKDIMGTLTELELHIVIALGRSTLTVMDLINKVRNNPTTLFKFVDNTKYYNALSNLQQRNIIAIDYNG